MIVSGQPSLRQKTRDCYHCDEIEHLAHCYPHYVPFAQTLGSQLARLALALAPKDTPQTLRGSIARGGTRGGL